MDKAMIALYSVQATLQVGLCVLMAYLCFENKLRSTKKQTAALAVLFIAVSVTIIELFIERTALFPGHSRVASIVWAGFAMVFLVSIIRTPPLHLFFAVFFLFTVTIKTAYISMQIEELGIFPPGEVSYILISMAVLCLMVPFMWYLLVVLFKKVIDLVYFRTHMQWLFFLPFAYFVLYLLVGNQAYRGRGWLGLVALLASNLVTYLSYVAILRMFLSMYESMTAARQVEQAEQAIRLQKQQYTQMARDIERSARIQHDFRHSAMVMKQFAQAGDLPGLLSYLEEYEKTAVPLDDAPICENTLVDVIVRHYIALAKQEGISVRATVPFPEHFGVGDNELVVLFGNLMENALESCRRQKRGERFIHVQTKPMSESVLAVQVSNSYDGEITRWENRFQSRKHSGLGIGISTIRLVAEKTGGNAEFTYQNGVFTARVLLVDKTLTNK